MRVHLPCILLLLVSVVHCSPAPDVPYEEQVPISILPLPSLWPAPALPTSYTPLPSTCGTLVGSAGSSLELGTLILCTNGSALSLYTPRDQLSLQITGLPGGVVLGGASLASGSVPATSDWTTALLLPGSGAVFALVCGDGSTGECAGRRVQVAQAAPLPGVVAASCLYPSAHQPGTAVTLVATGSDTVAWDLPATSPWASQALTLAGPLGWGATALAHSQALGELTLANATQVVYYRHGDLTQWRYWEWATNITSGAGGVYDDAVTALAYDEASGSLYVGMVECLNVRDRAGAVWRLGALDGLPWGNISSLAVDGVSSSGGWPYARLWIGTSKGAILFDPGAPAPAAVTTHQRQGGGGAAPFFARVQRTERAAAAGKIGGGAGSPPSPPLRQRWRYFYGPRYLVSSPGDAFDAGGAITSLCTDGALTTLLSPTAGVSVLEAQRWTLGAKVGVYEGAVARHTRLGQVSGCALPSFGVLEPCATGPDDNNGLWSSLTVGAEAMRYALTGDPSALDSAIEHAAGMRLLMQATGIRGLIARSVVARGSGVPPGGGDWHNSSAFPGYQWKGDASSDEVVGHLFAYPLVVNLLAGDPSPNASAAINDAREALVDLVRYITTNGYRLIDVTGKPTTWGHWEPSLLNVVRDDVSDTRGLNSLQMLALLIAGLGASEVGSADHATFLRAWGELTGPPYNTTSGWGTGTGYLENTLNLKILAPSDDNYSDDELTMLSYAAAFFSANLSGAASSVTPSQLDALTASLERTSSLLAPVKCALWNAITVSALGLPPTPQQTEDTLYSLRTWPLSLVDWPVRNSHRLDIVLDWEGERNGGGGQDRDSTTVLPANERCQTRWNANVHDLDGGSGVDESDPGAFLLSYWAARWAGLLAAEEAASV